MESVKERKKEEWGFEYLKRIINNYAGPTFDSVSRKNFFHKPSVKDGLVWRVTLLPAKLCSIKTGPNSYRRWGASSYHSLIHLFDVYLQLLKVHSASRHVHPAGNLFHFATKQLVFAKVTVVEQNSVQETTIFAWQHGAGKPMTGSQCLQAVFRCLRSPTLLNTAWIVKRQF